MILMKTCRWGNGNSYIDSDLDCVTESVSNDAIDNNSHSLSFSGNGNGSFGAVNSDSGNGSYSYSVGGNSDLSARNSISDSQ